MKRLVMSMGVGGEFPAGVRRLEAGLVANEYKGDTWLFDAYPPDCPTHKEIPYGFKPWLFRHARELGYEQVLWMDAACVPVRPLGGLWRDLQRDGCAFPWSHWSIGQWCSDAALETMEITREQAMAMCPSMWACVLGLDFRHDVASEFLAKWYEKSVDGKSFRGAWTNDNQEVSTDPRVTGHRHDQTIATILAYKLGMPFNHHVVLYDAGNIMPLRGHDRRLRLPDFPTPILANHNVKGNG